MPIEVLHLPPPVSWWYASYRKRASGLVNRRWFPAADSSSISKTFLSPLISWPLSGACRNWPTELFTQRLPGHVISRLFVCTSAPHREGCSVGEPVYQMQGSESNEGVPKEKFFTWTWNRVRKLWSKAQYASHRFTLVLCRYSLPVLIFPPSCHIAMKERIMIVGKNPILNLV